MVSGEYVKGMLQSDGYMVYPFHYTHIKRLGLDDDALGPVRNLGDLRERAAQVAAQGTAWTVFYQGQPAMSFGLTPLWDGVIEAWMLPGAISLKKAHLLTRGARRFFVSIAAEFDCRRIQIVVCVDHERAIQWAEFLGFKREGLMKRYGPEGKDYFMYART